MKSSLDCKKRTSDTKSDFYNEFKDVVAYFSVKCVAMNYNLLIISIYALPILGFSQHQEPYSATFISKLGHDTVAIETYTRFENHITGKAIVRIPSLHIRNFSIVYKEDGTIEECYIRENDPVNTSLPHQSINGYRFFQKMQFSQDSLFYTYYPEMTTRHHQADEVSFLGGWSPIMAQVEWNCLRLKRSNKKHLKSYMVNAYLGIFDLTVEELAEDTVLFGGPLIKHMKVAVDTSGNVSKIYGIHSAWNYLTTKHSPINLDTMIVRFVKKQPIGIPSPREKLIKNINGIPIEIEYGRPWKRGREIFGQIVPYDTVWRTGAGSCTEMRFGKPLKFQNIEIPAGKYCLYTIPGKSSWTLLFNTNLKRWPTNPDHSQHIAEIPMQVKSLNHVVSQLTINVIEKSGKAELQISWDGKQASVPFQIEE